MAKAGKKMPWEYAPTAIIAAVGNFSAFHNVYSLTCWLVVSVLHGAECGVRRCIYLGAYPLRRKYG